MYFNKTDLPLNNVMLNFWRDNGYLVIENFKSHEECDELINRSQELIEEQDFNNQQSVFDTVSQSHNDDNSCCKRIRISIRLYSRFGGKSIPLTISSTF